LPRIILATILFLTTSLILRSGAPTESRCSRRHQQYWHAFCQSRIRLPFEVVGGDTAAKECGNHWPNLSSKILSLVRGRGSGEDRRLPEVSGIYKLTPQGDSSHDFVSRFLELFGANSSANLCQREGMCCQNKPRDPVPAYGSSNRLGTGRTGNFALHFPQARLLIVSG
jgi:hypothetical protein